MHPLLLFSFLTVRGNVVVPLPFFLVSADFLEPIFRKLSSVNTKIGKSVTPNFRNIKILRVCQPDSSRFSEVDNPKIEKSGSVTVDLEYMYIRIYYLDHNNLCNKTCFSALISPFWAPNSLYLSGNIPIFQHADNPKDQ